MEESEREIGKRQTSLFCKTCIAPLRSAVPQQNFSEALPCFDPQLSCRVKIQNAVRMLKKEFPSMINVMHHTAGVKLLAGIFSGLSQVMRTIFLSSEYGFFETSLRFLRSGIARENTVIIGITQADDLACHYAPSLLQAGGKILFFKEKEDSRR